MTKVTAIKNKLKKIIIFVFLLVTIFGLNNDVLSGTDDRVIDPRTTTRLTYPGVAIGNHSYSTNEVFSYYEDRILMWEHSNSDQYPVGYPLGRGWIWANIADLRAGWTDRASYEAKAPKLPQYNNYVWQTSRYSVRWSPLSNENNIIYGLVNNGKAIIKMNVDTKVGSSLISNYDVDDSIDHSLWPDPFIVGWTSDNNLVVGADYNNPWGPGFEFNISTKAITYYSAYPTNCSELGRRFPTNGHGHNSKNKSKTYLADHYGQGQQNGVYNLTTCAFYEDCSWENKAILPITYVHDTQNGESPYTNHASWYGRDDWFSVSGGDRWQDDRLAPTMAHDYIWQVYPSFSTTAACGSGGKSFEYRLLLTVTTPYPWWWNPADQTYGRVSNSSQYLHCTMAKSGNRMYCTYTDNKWSYYDYKYGGASYSDYGYPGAWVYDLVPETGAVIKPDLNQDKNINLSDFSLFKTYFTTQNTQADFNHDSKTNTQDLGIMMSVWGTY